MKKILYANLIGLICIACYGFTPPSGNTTVMVNGSNVLVNPTATQLIDANPELSDYFKINGWQVNIDTTPSVNPIDGYQTQLKTLKINTPNIDLTDLLQGKLNRGELWFWASSYARTSSNPITGLPFSICATFQKSDYDAATYDVLSSSALGVFTNRVSSGGTSLSLVQHTSQGVKRTEFFALGDSSHGSRLTPTIDQYLRDGLNTIVCTASMQDTMIPLLKMYVNGVLVDSTSSPYTGAEWPSDNFSSPAALCEIHKAAATYAGSGSGSAAPACYSRLMTFNFDMSDANAPYTVADYQNGVDVPPSLKGALNWGIGGFTSLFYQTTNVSSAAVSGGVLTIAKTSGAVANVMIELPRTTRVGDKVILDFAADVKPYSIALNYETTPDDSTAQIFFTVNTTSGGVYPVVAEREYKYVRIMLGSSLTEINFSKLNVYVNGELLDLENYTFNDGNGQKIYDISGNGNDASITGNVAGTNDAAVAALYKAFTGNNATLSGSGYPPTGGSVIETLRAALNPDGTTYTTLYQYEDDIVVPTDWTDSEFKVLDSDGNLIYWVSTQWGAQMGGDYTTNDATDLNAKIFYTSPENEANGTGKGREWIEYVHNDVNARTIYEHAQGITGSPTPTIGGIIIQPNFSGTTVGGTSIQSIFGKNVLDAPSGYQFIYLKASPTNLEKTKTAYPIWRTIRPIPVQGGN